MVNKVETQKDNMILDSFVYDEEEYVVLNNDVVGDETTKEKILLGKVYIADSKKNIVPLEQVEYEEVLEYYLSLLSAFSKVEEE